MDNKITAQDIASYGRNGDTMLVHMTPDEVGGLQALAMAQGGSLTINPDTGLPEASFLSDTFKAFLPTIAGVGLSFIPGMQPWAAGLLVGGVEALRTKDLGRGLLAGLGAYGGAGLGKGLSATGAEAAQAELAGKAPIEIVDKSIASTPNYFNPSATLSENMTTQAAREGIVGGVKSPFMGMQYGGETVFGGIPGSQLEQQLAQKTLENQLTTTVSPSLVPMDRAASEFTKAGFGLQDLGQEGGLGRFKDAYVAGMGGGKQALLGAAGVAGSIAGGYGAFDQPQVAFPEQEKYDDATYIAADRTYLPQSRESILGGEGREHQYFDVVNPVPGYRTLNAARGGLLALNKMNKGGLLQGPGDGVSDSIPAVIKGSNQPVMLSDGEYIIPAEVVSAVGEGSTASGERKFTNVVNTIMNNTRKYAKGKENGSDKLLKGLIPTA